MIRRATQTLSAAGIALLLLTTAGCAIPSADDEDCLTVAPDGASEAAQAYAAG